ncbi:hypothetical protein CR513_34569, partial [Mucuna pruriens]
MQTIQTETNTLSTEFTKLQVPIFCDKLTFALLLSHKDNSELKIENNEYKLRLQVLEQQSQLKDGLYTFLCYFMHQLTQTCFNLFSREMALFEVATFDVLRYVLTKYVTRITYLHFNNCVTVWAALNKTLDEKSGLNFLEQLVTYRVKMFEAESRSTITCTTITNAETIPQSNHHIGLPLETP